MLYTYLKADKIDFWEKGWLGGQGVDDLIGGQGMEDEIFLHIFNSLNGNVRVFLAQTFLIHTFQSCRSPLSSSF